MKASFTLLGLLISVAAANPVPAPPLPPVHPMESMEQRISVLEFNQGHLRHYLSFVQQQLVRLNNQVQSVQEQINDLEPLSSSSDDDQ